MTQSDVCATGSRPKEEPFIVTDVMRERFDRALSKCVAEIGQMWRDNGEDVDSDEGRNALAMVRHSMSVPERPEWMHPLDALGVVTMTSDYTDSPELHLQGRDAQRTIWGLTEKEWHQVVSDATGLGLGYLRHRYGTKAPDKEARRQDLETSRTAVYRHYDSAERLLYVGITADFKVRDAMHKVASPWWKHVARTETEWLPDRSAALVAEAAAIRSESPIFNSVHVRDHHKHERQAKYLRVHRVG